MARVKKTSSGEGVGTDLGPRGEFKWIPKHLLEFDPSYQRKVNDPAIIKIANAFAWSNFSACSVSYRKDANQHFVFDGQHRVLAALRRADVNEVPCLVFDFPSRAEEAKAFLAINEHRRAARAFDKWKARKIADDETTLFCESLIASVGRKPADYAKHDTVSCLGRMARWANTERETLIAMWPLIADVCKGERLTDGIMSGLMWVETNLAEGHSLLSARWRLRVQNVGYNRLSAITNEARTHRHGGNAAVLAWGAAILKALNEGRTNCLVPTPEAMVKMFGGGRG